MSKVLYFVSVCLIALPLAACGGKSEAEKESEAAKSGEGTITCEGSPLSGDPGLPANFPKLPETTYVSAVDKGPTRVVDGFATDGIDGVYHEMKDRFQEEQYTILFDELEDKDSEISYRSPDGKTEGQLALRAACDNGNTSIHITARPAS